MKEFLNFLNLILKEKVFLLFQILLKPLRFAIFSIIFVDNDNFSQAVSVEIDASILSIGGNCP